MNNIQKIDAGFKTLSEVHQKITFADTKANFTVVVALALFAADTSLAMSIAHSITVNIVDNLASGIVLTVSILCIVATFICLGLCLVHAIKAIYPRLSSEEKSKSLLYFGSIASQKREDFKQSFVEGTEDTLIEDISDQVYENSIIAMKKFKGVGDSARYLIYGLSGTGALALINFIFVILQ